MSIWALVPFKGAAGAKRRLESLLSAEEREDLVYAMLRDVLGALTRCPALGGVLLVSRDETARTLATEFDVRLFADSAPDLSAAVVEASDFLVARFSATGTLFMPGDVPLVRPADIAAVLRGHEQVTLVPDANDVGTNAAVSSPPNAFEYLFDGKSFKPHLASAAKVGIAARVVRRHALGLDVDTAAELATVAGLADGTWTGAFLQARGIHSRLAQAARPAGRV